MRVYEPSITPDARDLVDRLPGEKDVQRYRRAMHELGRELARSIVPCLRSKQGLMVVCTNEDADFLARGFVEYCSAQDCQLFFTCFWNQRVHSQGLKATTIVKSYVEPCPSIKAVVVLKSIIATSCVVQRNLSELLDRHQPDQIFIAAPVLLAGAQQRLREAFPNQQGENFRFCWFAEDDQRLDNGDVVPGVGGSVYELLGVGSSVTKNRYIPDIVKSRRRQLALASTP